MRRRRIDPTLVAFAIILLVAVGLVTTFLIFTSIVAQDDARIYPTAATPYPYYSQSYPPPVPTSQAAILGPALDPRPASVSHTIDGITIVVQPRYADLHRVVLTYTISGPTLSYPYTVGLGPDLSNWPRLTLDNGIELPSNRLNLSETPYSDWLSLPSGEPTPNEGILSFDTSPLLLLPSNLAMHLTMPIHIENTPYALQYNVPTVAPATFATATPATPVTFVPPSSKTLTFDFDLSTRTDNRCRQAQPAVSTEKAGVRFTLDSVSVTASELRVSLTFTGTYAGQPVSSTATGGFTGGWNASGTMDTGPGTNQFALWNNCSYSPCGPFTGFHYRGDSLLDAPEKQWLLKIDNLNNDQGNGYITGPWILKFDVPPASLCTSIPNPQRTALPTTPTIPTP